MKVTLVDYGAGNLPSVERAVRRLGADVRCAATPEDLDAPAAIVLPGVGHFSALIRTLEERELMHPLREALEGGVPFLGICLGLQALCEGSEEAPGCSGLGFLTGRARPLPSTVKLPHMGWNQLRRRRPTRWLVGIPEDAYFYFAHSYAVLEPSESTVAVCDYGTSFVAVFEQDNLYGVQFHPEKSGAMGSHVLANFLKAVR
jgi:imidazole glycerol phosphate synthase glutamine amidotransferase subunit